MPRQIDEEVVSMQFENAKFEKNVKESMNTLDKLKEKLKFDGATKGLDEIEKASKKIDFSNLEKGIDDISDKFSAKTYAMQQLIWSLTDSAIEMGKKLIASSSIGQAANGWKKYEEQTVNVQTILSAVSTKINELTGELYNVEDVYDVMDRIAWYADETSYSADQMTRAIADFSSSGQDLYLSKNMIEGIANACALAGVNANKAESAFTGFSKAIGEGYVSNRVWTGFLKTSGITANEGFKQACLDAAVAVGTLVEAEEGLYLTTDKALKATGGGEIVTLGDFASQLTKEAWLTTEVMEEVFNEYTGDLSRAYEMYSSGQVKTTTEAIRAIKKEYEDAGEEIPTWLKSFQSAQEAVTYTQVIESIQTASASAWESIYASMFGNIDEQREIWTLINNELYNLIVQPIWDLQEVVDDAFRDHWGDLRNEIEATGVSMDDFESGFVKWMEKQGIRIDELIEAEGSLQNVFKSGKVSVNWIIKYLEQLGETAQPIVEVTNNLEEFQKVYDAIWNGEFGNGADRIKALTDAGYDYAAMQGLINDLAEKGHKGGYKLTADDIANLSTEQLKSIGYTEEQVAALKDLAQQAKESGTPIGELMEKLSRPSGKDLLKDSLVNLIKVANNLKTILQGIFSAVFQNGEGIIYNLLDIINKFTAALVRLTDPETMVAKLLNAIASAIGLVYRSIAGLIKGVINTFNKVLELLGINLENVSNWIGVAFDWFSEFARSSNIPNFFEKIGNVILVLAGAVKLLFNTIKKSSIVNKVLNGFASAWTKIKDVFSQITKGGSGFKTITEEFKKLKEIIGDSTIEDLNAVEEGIKNFIKAIGSFISVNFRNIIKNVKDLIKNCTLLKNVSDFLKPIGDAFKNLFNSIKNSNEINSLKKAFEDLINVFKSGDVTDIKKFFETLGTFFKSVKGIGVDVLKNMKDGFIEFGDGLKKALPEEALKRFDWFLEIALAMLLIYSSYNTLDKFADAIKTLLTPLTAFEKIGGAFGKVGDAVSKYFKSKEVANITKNVALIAVAIGVMVAAFYALAQLGDVDALWNVIGVMGAFAGIVAILIAVCSSPMATVGIKNLAIAMIGLGGSLAIMALSLSQFKGTTIEQSPLNAVIYFITGLLGLVVALLLLSNFAGTKDLTKTYIPLLSIAASMLLVSFAFEKLANVKTDNMLEIVLAFGAIVSAIVIASLLLNSAGGSSIGKQISSMAASFILIALAMKILGGIKTENAMSAIAGITTIFAGLFLLSLAMHSKYESSNANLGKSVAEATASILLIAVAMKVLAGISEDDLMKGIKIIGILMALLAAFSLVTKLIELIPAGKEGSAKGGVAAAASIIGMSLSLLLIAGTLLLFKNLDKKDLLKSVGIVALLFASMGLALLLANKTKALEKSGANSVKVIGKMVAAFAVLAVAVAALSFIGTKKLLISAGSMLALVLAMGLVLEACGSIKEKNSGAIAKTILGMIAIVAACAGVLYVLFKNIKNPESLVPIATGLGILLLTLAGSIAILNKSGGTTKKWSSIGKMITEMAAMIVLCGVVLGLLQNFVTDPMSLIPIATALGIVMLALSGSMAVLTNFGMVSGKTDWTTVFKTIVMMVAMIGTVALALGVLSNQIQNPDNLITIAGAMALVMLALAPLSVALGSALAACTAANLGGGGFAALGLLVSVIIISIAIAALVIYLASLVPDVAPIKHAGDVLEAVGDAIGRCIGAFVGGVIGESIEGTLAGLGRGIASLSEGLVPFIEVINTVPEGFVGKCSAVMLGIAEIIGVEILSTLANGVEMFAGIFGVKSSLNEDLITFAQAMVQFSNELDGINVSRVNAAAKAASGLADLMNALPSEGGIISWFTGDSSHSLENFATGLSGLALGLTSMSDNMKDFDPSCAEKATSAGKAMAELYNVLPKEGGLAQDIFGSTQSMSTFGENIKNYCEYIVAAMDTIAGAENLNEATWNKAKAAGDTFSELQNGLLSNTGDSLYSILMGKQQDLTDFGNGIATFCTALVDMGTLMNGGTTSYGFDSPGFKEEALDKAILAGQTIDEFQKTLSGTSGLFDKLENGSEHMSLSELGEELIKFADYLIEFSNKLYWTDFTQVSAVGILLSGIANVETITQPLLANVDMVVLVYKDHIKKRMEETATYLLQIYQKNFIAALNQYYDAKYNGQKTLEGLINGLTTPSYLARIAQAGTDAANAFKDAFRIAMDIHSPSGVMEEAGGFTIAGLVKGIEDNLTSVRDAGIETGATMIGAIAESVAYAEDALSGDAVSPVITPVLDLSLVQQQAQGINGMMPGTSMALAGGIQNGVPFSNNGTLVNNAINIDFTVNNAGRDLSEDDISKYGKMIADKVNFELGQLV